jgi:geranylgeranyl reductase family protein
MRSRNSYFCGVRTINGDIIISGAGPAGATMALMLAGSGLRVTIIDKDRFPRDKICGDALSGQVVSILKRMPDSIFDEFLEIVPKTPSYGIRFVSPGMHIADIPFITKSFDQPPGYICPRREFDSFLISKVKNYRNIHLVEGERIVQIRRADHSVTAITERYEVTGRMIAGADGVHSAARSLLEQAKPSREQLCTGVRAYFEGVADLHPEKYIELLFLKELLPFYFWIFPEVNGRCNAGLAMLQSEISSNRVNMGKLFDEIIRFHPSVSPRFAGARMVGRVEAHALPLGAPPGPFSGDRFLLVDPFTGEGIGNAMTSGEVAARVVRNCFITGDFSAKGLGAYDVQLKRRIGKELSISSGLHKMARSMWLVDLIIRSAGKSKAFRKLFLFLISIFPKW